VLGSCACAGAGGPLPGILSTRYLVLVQPVHEPRGGRDMKCSETKGDFTGFFPEVADVMASEPSVVASHLS